MEVKLEEIRELLEYFSKSTYKAKDSLNPKVCKFHLLVISKNK